VAESFSENMARPYKLSFEHHRHAFAIGESTPRISWKIEGHPQNWEQSSYQLEISRQSGKGPETFRVQSSQQVLVQWPAEPLRSGESASVRVRVVDNNGKQTPWSERVNVEAGLLSPEDWTCQLVHCAKREDLNAPHTPVLFRREFQVQSDVKQARLYISAHGLYEAEINGQRVGDHVLAPGWTSYQYELPYQTYDVTSLLKPGNNVIGAYVGEGWYVGRFGFNGGVRNIWGDTIGLIAQLEITYSDGQSDTIATDS
jgi:alpha-L-rhamnosidase